MYVFRPRFTLSIMTLCVLMLVVGMTAAQDNTPLRFPQNVRAAGLVTAVGLSQTVDDVTVTLDWAYADTQQLAVGYTVEGILPDVLFTPFSPPPNLRTADGGVFSYHTGYPVTDSESSSLQMTAVYYSQVLRPDSSGNWTVDNDYFSSAFDTLPETIDLQFEMTFGGFTVPANMPMPSGSALTPGETIDTAGPFVFDFESALAAPLKIEPEQTAEADAISMTLKRVTLTPSQIEVVLCYDMPSAQDWLPHASLTVNDVPTLQTGMGITTTKDNPAESNSSAYRCRLLQFDAAYDGEPTTLHLATNYLATTLVEVPDEWNQIKDILAQEGIEIEVNFSQGENGGGGLGIEVVSIPDGVDFDQAVNQAREKLGGVILGPWDFTIEIP